MNLIYEKGQGSLKINYEDEEVTFYTEYDVYAEIVHENNIIGKIGKLANHPDVEAIFIPLEGYYDGSSRVRALMNLKIEEFLKSIYPDNKEFNIIDCGDRIVVFKSN